MSIARPTSEEIRELYFLFAPDKAAYPRIPNVPPLVLATHDAESLMRILDKRHRTTIARSLLRDEYVLPAAVHFPGDLYLQRVRSASALEKDFRTIQTAALELLDALAIRDARRSELPYDIGAHLQIAASTYGNEIGTPDPAPPPGTIPWNFWAAYKLPSVVVGVSLLEHWAGMARARLRTQFRKRALNRGNTAFRVLIHRLALAWLHTTGEAPGAGYSAYRRGESAFTRFVARYLVAMRSAITEEHLRYTPTIHKELIRTHDAIRAQLRIFKRRLPPKGKRR